MSEGKASVFSKSNTDIGKFKINGKTVFFRIPVKDYSHLKLTTSKTTFVGPNLMAVAMEFLEKLTKMDVVERAFAIFNAPAYYLIQDYPTFKRNRAEKQLYVIKNYH